MVLHACTGNPSTQEAKVEASLGYTVRHHVKEYIQSIVKITLRCQFQRIWDHHGNILLGVSMRLFPEMLK